MTDPDTRSIHYTPWGLPYPDTTDKLTDTDWHIRNLKWNANNLLANRNMRQCSAALTTNSGGYVFIPTGLSKVTGGVVMVQGPNSSTRYMWSVMSGGGTTLDVRFYVPSTGNPVGAGIGFWLKALAWGTP